MSRSIDRQLARLLRKEFPAFVAYAFQEQHGDRLGHQHYVDYLCYEITQFISENTKRLLINLPPQHLKTFVCTVCLAAFMLGKNPRIRLLVVAYDDSYAAKLARAIRELMDASWFQQVFLTRIKTGHDRATDFGTAEGGYVYAVGAQGRLTGYTADVIIYDDPHQFGDWQNQRAKDAVKDSFTTLLSRLENKTKGRVIVVAHRVAEDDLSSELISDPRWKCVQIPFIAPRAKTYRMYDGRYWVRPRGDLLRPDAYPADAVEELKRGQVSPPYALFHQQGIDKHASRAIKAEHFGSFDKFGEPIAPVVLSIDPGQSGGINASRSAIQAWKAFGRSFYLIDQSCEQCDFTQLAKEVRRFIRRHNPSVMLIEKTANGPALYSDLNKMKPRFERKLISPRGTKGERLEQHRSAILNCSIWLPADALWRGPFIDEIVGFPGHFDDQIDAMTQYLDFISSKPMIKVMPPREHGIAVAMGSEFVRRRF
jgi:predicted phage terminase large subunit-like protein